MFLPHDERSTDARFEVRLRLTPDHQNLSSSPGLFDAIKPGTMNAVEFQTASEFDTLFFHVPYYKITTSKLKSTPSAVTCFSLHNGGVNERRWRRRFIIHLRKPGNLAPQTISTNITKQQNSTKVNATDNDVAKQRA